MAVARARWTRPFNKNSGPNWPCPRCKHDSLRLDKASLAIAETADSRLSRNHPDFDPDWLKDRFSCLLKCTTSRCQDVVAVAGWTSYEPTYDEEGGTVWEESLHPTFVTPVPDFFPIPAKCSESIATEIRNAFALFWADRGASANRVRSSVELLMDSLGIQKSRRTKAKKLERLSLHERIEIFQKTEQAVGAALLALKWIGNTGSHPGDLSAQDLLDAFDILNHAMDEVIEKRTKQIEQLVTEINRSKGPRSLMRKRQRKRS